MSTGRNLSTPLCECEPSDPKDAFVQPVPSPQVASALLAPYTVYGCVDPAVEDLELSPNWWRASPNTKDAHPCRVIWSPGEPTPCRGGRSDNVDDYCEPNRGLTGPRCKACLNEGTYFSATEAKCVGCPVVGGEALALPIGIVMGILAGCYLLLKAWRKRQQWLGGRLPTVDALVDQGMAIAPKLGLMGKAKIALSYLQIVLIMPELFELAMPPEYYGTRAPSNHHHQTECTSSFFPLIDCSRASPQLGCRCSTGPESSGWTSP